MKTENDRREYYLLSASNVRLTRDALWDLHFSQRERDDFYKPCDLSAGSPVCRVRVCRTGPIHLSKLRPDRPLHKFYKNGSRLHFSDLVPGEDTIGRTSLSESAFSELLTLLNDFRLDDAHIFNSAGEEYSFRVQVALQD